MIHARVLYIKMKKMYFNSIKFVKRPTKATCTRWWSGFGALRAISSDAGLQFAL